MEKHQEPDFFDMEVDCENVQAPESPFSDSQSSNNQPANNTVKQIIYIEEDSSDIDSSDGEIGDKATLPPQKYTTQKVTIENVGQDKVFLQRRLDFPASGLTNEITKVRYSNVSDELGPQLDTLDKFLNEVTLQSSSANSPSNKISGIHQELPEKHIELSSNALGPQLKTLDRILTEVTTQAPSADSPTNKLSRIQPEVLEKHDELSPRYPTEEVNISQNISTSVNDTAITPAEKETNFSLESCLPTFYPSAFKLGVIQFSQTQGLEKAEKLFDIPSEVLEGWMKQQDVIQDHFLKDKFADWERDLFLEIIFALSIGENVTLKKVIDKRIASEPDSFNTQNSNMIKWAVDWCKQFHLHLNQTQEICDTTTLSLPGFSKSLPGTKTRHDFPKSRFSQAFKREVLRYVESNSIEDAFRKYKVRISTIKRWIPPVGHSAKPLEKTVFKSKNVSVPDRRRDNLKSQLLEWYRSMEKKGKVMHHSLIISKARSLARKINWTNFDPTTIWFNNWSKNYLQSNENSSAQTEERTGNRKEDALHLKKEWNKLLDHYKPEGSSDEQSDNSVQNAADEKDAQLDFTSQDCTPAVNRNDSTDNIWPSSQTQTIFSHQKHETDSTSSVLLSKKAERFAQQTSATLNSAKPETSDNRVLNPKKLVVINPEADGNLLNRKEVSLNQSSLPGTLNQREESTDSSSTSSQSEDSVMDTPLNVVKYAYENGVSAASLCFGVSESVIGHWCRTEKYFEDVESEDSSSGSSSNYNYTKSSTSSKSPESLKESFQQIFLKFARDDKDINENEAKAEDLHEFLQESTKEIYSEEPTISISNHSQNDSKYVSQQLAYETVQKKVQSDYKLRTKTSRTAHGIKATKSTCEIENSDSIISQPPLDTPEVMAPGVKSISLEGKTTSKNTVETPKSLLTDNDAEVQIPSSTTSFKNKEKLLESLPKTQIHSKSQTSISAGLTGEVIPPAYPACFQIRVVQCAEIKGLEAASEEYGLSKLLVKNWINLKASNKLSSQSEKFREWELDLYVLIHKWCQKSQVASLADIISKGQNILSGLNLSDLYQFKRKQALDWCKRFGVTTSDVPSLKTEWLRNKTATSSSNTELVKSSLFSENVKATRKHEFRILKNRSRFKDIDEAKASDNTGINVPTISCSRSNLPKIVKKSVGRPKGSIKSSNSYLKQRSAYIRTSKFPARKHLNGVNQDPLEKMQESSNIKSPPIGGNSAMNVNRHSTRTLANKNSSRPSLEKSEITGPQALEHSNSLNSPTVKNFKKSVYSDDFRAKVLHRAKTHGISEASSFFRISKTVIRFWGGTTGNRPLKFSPEFKTRALKFHDKFGSAKACRKFNIHPTNLSSWKIQRRMIAFGADMLLRENNSKSSKNKTSNQSDNKSSTVESVSPDGNAKKGDKDKKPASSEDIVPQGSKRLKRFSLKKTLNLEEAEFKGSKPSPKQQSTIIPSSRMNKCVPSILTRSKSPVIADNSHPQKLVSRKKMKDSSSEPTTQQTEYFVDINGKEECGAKGVDVVQTEAETQDCLGLAKPPDSEEIVLECRRIRVGSYKVVEADEKLLVKVTCTEIKFELNNLPGDKLVAISLQRNDISSVLANFCKSVPTLLIYTTPECAENIRNLLNMTSKDKTYFDPCHTNETMKPLVILPKCITTQQMQFLLTKFPGDLVQEIQQSAAFEILVKSTPLFQKNKNKSSPKKESKNCQSVGIVGDVKRNSEGLELEKSKLLRNRKRKKSESARNNSSIESVSSDLGPMPVKCPSNHFNEKVTKNISSPRLDISEDLPSPKDLKVCGNLNGNSSLTVTKTQPPSQKSTQKPTIEHQKRKKFRLSSEHESKECKIQQIGEEKQIDNRPSLERTVLKKYSSTISDSHKNKSGSANKNGKLEINSVESVSCHLGDTLETHQKISFNNVTEHRSRSDKSATNLKESSNLCSFLKVQGETSSINHKRMKPSVNLKKANVCSSERQLSTSQTKTPSHFFKSPLQVRKESKDHNLSANSQEQRLSDSFNSDLHLRRENTSSSLSASKDETECLVSNSGLICEKITQADVKTVSADTNGSCFRGIRTCKSTFRNDQKVKTTETVISAIKLNNPKRKSSECVEEQALDKKGVEKKKELSSSNSMTIVITDPGIVFCDWVKEVNTKLQTLMPSQVVEKLTQIVKKTHEDFVDNWLFRLYIDEVKFLDHPRTNFDNLSSVLGLAGYVSAELKLELLSYMERRGVAETSKCFQISSTCLENWKDSKPFLQKVLRVSSIFQMISKHEHADLDIYEQYIKQLEQKSVVDEESLKSTAMKVYAEHGLNLNRCYKSFAERFLRITCYDNMENAVLAKVLEQFDLNLNVTKEEVINYYQSFLQQGNVKAIFSTCELWFEQFCERNSMFLVQRPNVNDILPPELNIKVNTFRKVFLQLQAETEFHYIGSMDEIPFSFDCGTSDNVKNTPVLRNCNLTHFDGVVLLSCLANGQVFPPFVVFKLASKRNKNYLSEVNDSVLSQWLQRVWVPNVPEGKSVLILDSFAPHAMPKFTSLAKCSNVTLTTVPIGCNSKVHPVAAGLCERFQQLFESLRRTNHPGVHFLDKSQVITLVNDVHSKLSKEVEFVKRCFEVTSVVPTKQCFIENYDYLFENVSV